MHMHVCKGVVVHGPDLRQQSDDLSSGCWRPLWPGVLSINTAGIFFSMLSLLLRKVCPEGPERSKPDLLMGESTASCLTLVRRKLQNFIAQWRCTESSAVLLSWVLFCFQKNKYAGNDMGLGPVLT